MLSKRFCHIFTFQNASLQCMQWSCSSFLTNHPYNKHKYATHVDDLHFLNWCLSFFIWHPIKLAHLRHFMTVTCCITMQIQRDSHYSCSIPSNETTTLWEEAWFLMLHVHDTYFVFSVLTWWEVPWYELFYYGCFSIKVPYTIQVGKNFLVMLLFLWKKQIFKINHI